MTNHTDLLNYIAAKTNARHYLEIGVFNPDHNFNKIDVMHKLGVDPDPNAKATVCKTSDEFFDIAKQFGDKFDIIWIDGLHHADQVKKDIINAWRCIPIGGIIALHDCNPPTEATTCIPRGKQREWCGDVFKTICQINSPFFFTVDFDYGCTVIRKTEDPLEFNDANFEWDHFNSHRTELLNLKSIEQAKEIIDQWT